MPRPMLLINPHADGDFVAFAEEQLAAIVPKTAVELEAALRVQYPRATVRERVLSNEATTTWYVYREGRWIPNGT